MTDDEEDQVEVDDADGVVAAIIRHVSQFADEILVGGERGFTGDHTAILHWTDPDTGERYDYTVTIEREE